MSLYNLYTFSSASVDAEQIKADLLLVYYTFFF